MQNLCRNELIQNYRFGGEYTRYESSLGENDIIQSFIFQTRRSLNTFDSGSNEYFQRRLPLITPSTLTSELLPHYNYSAENRNNNDSSQELPYMQHGYVLKIKVHPYECIINSKNKECIICLLDNKIEWTIIKKCKHEFCKECIIKWFENLPKTCPVCREKV